ncbi:TetR family transcriptional regulator [Amycolatopsis mediterranei S699]|uniref:TetR family transcriptional regulator n=2 Tax=Amycolatopsis mediterranei TaxID=33910 RepID=A0A0H3CXK0_AMYMU|nr:TetR/AcrR family transcriptional regulator C-terminal domain-containing protein [Amycolatopsis mediterranei]ADJ43063.1 TetR family transcriptional regulator [Amycolatopsis mediterranei U32]AEK39759.1 TetR family transcriptional regulator [Amycolatopsis mediterranei S699]AFO74777.1 TetR family transcriptional regulator [Amycolatopsis mediterranei S699]AGT81906.1 TetR family transcriptional regulator [Amycolatopsis mediterranei RB]KDO04972.1 TetR family transcriptional regulator [Amycolatopsi
MALTRENIARSGLKLLNEVGLNGLTLRLIAADLGVKAPALYWHMKNKQELLDEMATQMYRESAADRRPPASAEEWEGAAHSARALRRMMLAYRDGGKVFAGTYLGDTSLVGEHPLRRSIEAGVDEQRASRATFTVYCFVIGYVIEEQAVRPMPGEFDERYRESAGEAVLGDADARFEDGLAMVLSGARQWLETT